MRIRLNQVCKELNIDIQTAVEFLSDEGIQIESNPAVRIDEKEYALLCNAYNYNKTSIHDNHSDTKSGDDTESDLFSLHPKKSEPIGVRVLGKIDLDGINRKAIQTTEKDKSVDDSAKKRHPRCLGFVKFYDQYKGFGFIITNKHITQTGSCVIDSIYVNQSNLSGCSSLNDEQWVSFEKKKGKRGVYADNVKIVEYTAEDVKLALSYCGIKSNINGYDKKREFYDVNIFCHIASQFEKKNGTQELFGEISTFFSIIDDSEKRENRIRLFLSEPKVRTFIFGVEPDSLDDISKSIIRRAFQMETSENSDAINWSEFNKWQEYIEFSEATYDILTKVAFDDVNIVDLSKQSDVLIRKIVKRAERCVLTAEQLKRIYIINPAKAELFLPEESDEPFIKGVIYVLKGNAEDNVDSDTFLAMISESKIAHDFLNKYLSINRRDDAGLLEIDKANVDKLPQDLSDSLVLNLPLLIALCYFFKNNKFSAAGLLTKGCLDNPTFRREIIEILFSEDFIKKTSIESFIEFVKPFTLGQVQNFTRGCSDLSNLPKSFVVACIHVFETPVWGNLPSLPADYYILSYILTDGDASYLSDVDYAAINQWLAQNSPEECSKFIYLAINKNIKIVESVQIENVAKGISRLENAVQAESLDKLPVDMAKEIVSVFFDGTELKRYFIQEQWDRLKLDVSHITFDIESDGENIKEFAFRFEENTRKYEGQRRIRSLIRRLSDAPIIVGHNIKEWDLPILSHYGLDVVSGFIWDTLEIELLLNPCRYAYALHTSHNAKDDTELTDSLFWNQLLRLSNNPELCKLLESYLPNQIHEYIQLISDPFFSDYLNAEARNEYQFFQELVPLDKSLIGSLRNLNEQSKSESILIIAPKDLWPRIAQYVSLRFPTSTTLSLRSIDAVSSALEGIGGLKQVILKRFSEESETPVVANIPLYLRTEKSNNDLFLSDDELYELSIPSHGRIDCIEFADFEQIDKLKSSYLQIVTIGGELYDRVHREKIGETYDSLSPQIILSKLFFSMASCNYSKVPQSDFNRFGIVKDDLTASIWAERDPHGKISFFKNFRFKLTKEIFLSNYKSAHCRQIEWRLHGQQKTDCSPTMVSVKTSDQSVRLAESTTLRSKYWANQLAVIAALNPNRPIIYVVNESAEIDALTDFVKTLGYFIPDYGSGFRKLEYIGSHPKSIVIINKDQFVNGISEYRSNIPYCYVWDNMDIDRLKLMWDVLPFEDDTIADDASERDITSGRTSSRKCIVAAWPIICHYYSLVRANSRESQMFVIDPHFDENPDIADICGCPLLTVKDPAHDNAYGGIELSARDCFNDFENTMPELDVGQAMEAIRVNFIPRYNWHDYQREILPHILKRGDDLLISLPTGGGKSILFQGPALYRAATSRRLTLVISPLRALMQDQVEELTEKGFGNTVDYISGDRTYPEVQEIYRRIRGGEIALLYITPERFRVRRFTQALNERIEHDHGLEYIVFDEAHCISQWGQEFRPDYRNAILECAELKSRYDIRLCLFSATVTSQIEEDIRKFLPGVIRLGQSVEDYNPVRKHIGISFKLSGHEEEQRINEILEYIINNNIDFHKSRMIVFCRTHKQCEAVSAVLAEQFATSEEPRLKDISRHIGFFHAGMDSDQRSQMYRRFKGGGEVTKNNEDVYVLCATKAFGMGMDIPNIHYVLHFSPPSVIEDYLQEVGRAGRNEDMYRNTFSDGRQIPAQCLVSMEDFRRLKELLIRSMMSWSDLEMARQKVTEYILRFKDDKTIASQSQIVVPFDVWSKDESPEKFNDTTASRIAFHWLEKLKLISLGFLDQACLDVTMLKPWSPIGIKAPKGFMTDIASALSHYCGQIGIPSLIPIRQVREMVNKSWPKIVDVLLQAQQRGILSINDTIRCVIKTRRTSETKYMLERKENKFALHIILEGMQSLLSDINVGKSHVFEAEDMMHIIRHLTDDVSYTTITEKNGKNEMVEYMPWGRSEVRMDVTRAETFKKDITARTGPKMFRLLNLIPGVSSVEKKEEDGSINLTVTVLNDKWKEYIPAWESELFSILRFVSAQDAKFKWSQMLFDIQLFTPGIKSYTYLENSLSFLKALQYIDYSPLVRSGIEVQPSIRAFDPIDEGTDESSQLYPLRQEFDQEEKTKKIRLSAMDIFTKISNDKQTEFIRKYFQCRNYEDFLGLVGDFCPNDCSDLLSELSEEALTEAEGKLKDNEAQRDIYNSPIMQNINVLAGPGSGKTHVLTLRCAKLVYREHVSPSNILVLAYNRAVVVELKNRLNKLFRRLGLSRMAHQMHVYTFHALAKVIMGSLLDNIPTEEWEHRLYNFIGNNKSRFRAIFPSIEHVLIDEFQDITSSRLKTIGLIQKYYPDAKFFTIGDINQSIYGFDRVAGFKGTPAEYAELLRPEPYYRTLRELLNPMEFTMFTNYRSYQAILDKSAEFIPQGCDLPKSATPLMIHEPKEQYVHEFTNEPWFRKLPKIIEKSKIDNATGIPQKRVDTIAVFFRTNDEVYRGFTQVKKLNLDSSVRVRIQGTSSFELWRQREFYHIISWFSKNPDNRIVLKNNETKSITKQWIEQIISSCPHWDAYYLDVAYTIVLHYLESIRADEQTHTYGELAEFMKEIAGNDDGGQVFKIYDEYQTERILKDSKLTIVLTTMHKVKGLEFDVVVVTPSFASLPFKQHRQYESGQQLKEDDLADIEEEKRLRFVAYTRARKALYIFVSDREQALLRGEVYSAPEKLQERLGIVEKNPGLDNYNLGYHSNSSYTFGRQAVLTHIAQNTQVKILRQRKSFGGKTWDAYEIVDAINSWTLGELSSTSSIRKKMESDDIGILIGLFVSDIFAWEYQDSVKSDKRNGTNYSSKWIPQAKEQGFVYIVKIAGFGIPNS